MKTQLEEELSKAYGELEVTQQKIDSLRKVQESIQKRLNSLLYYVDLEKNLKKQKYLSGGIFRKTDLTQLPPLQLFDILDLRRKDGITLHAADYNLKKFSKVVVYPKSFQLDIDYKLIYNEKKDEVIIFLKRPYKFKQQKIVIAIQ